MARTTTHQNAPVVHETVAPIILPWPPAALSPNARGHWSARARAAKRYRADCWALAKAAKARVDWGGLVALRLNFVPPSSRRRDDDNLVAAFKSGRDGIADALGIDDSRFVTTFMLARGRTIKGGAVEVEIGRVVG